MRQPGPRLSIFLAFVLLTQTVLAPTHCLVRTITAGFETVICTSEGTRSVLLTADGDEAPPHHAELPFRTICHSLPAAPIIAAPVLPRPAEPATIAFVARQGAAARWVTSVCTGSLVLGAAGLLRGYQATTHWLVRDLLPLFGATSVIARAVTDRNRMTEAGVTAGIDFGLTLLARLRDPAHAQAVQLMSEYDPAPPFQGGSPEHSPPEITSLITTMQVDFGTEMRRASEAAAGRMPG